jgi:hypothetical protein
VATPATPGGIKRPGIVTFIGVVLYFQAVMALVVAVVMIAFKSRFEGVLVNNNVTLTSDGILATGIVELALAIVLFFVASGIMRGSRGYRTFVAIVEIIRAGTALFFMLFHHSGAYIEGGFLTILVALFVIWALYHERAEEWFESTG